MTFFRKLVVFLLLHLIKTQQQINLDLTDWVSTQETNDVVQHDCLHAGAPLLGAIAPYQIISYCMSVWPSKWNIIPNTLDQRFTFAELHQQNITSQQLYRWSAPMDLVEDYQFYLNELSTSNQSPAMSAKRFYNCTLPQFGSLCQYSLDIQQSNHLSLDKMIDNFYLQRYEPTTMTCYVHLECNRGSTLSCLDWTEICDGNVDCLNDGIDEKDCWQVETNKCEENEYRCDNGPCIPKIYINDDVNSFDCIDRSDEPLKLSHFGVNVASPPSFAYEDVKCSKEYSIDISFSSSCVNKRHHLIFQGMFLNEPNAISDDCWFAFRCYFRIPDPIHPRCNDICINKTCKQIIIDTCPEMFYFPNVPIFFGHIYLAYTKQDALKAINQILPPSYICYNGQLCDGFSSNNIGLSFNHSICRRPEDFSLHFSESEGNSWMNTYAKPIFRQLYKCKTIKTDNSVVCDKTIMYQCMNSTKCIPNIYIGDGIEDCNYGDDEQQTVINDVCLKYQPKTLFQCPMTNICIFHHKVRNGACDCPCDDFGSCDDEFIEVSETRKRLPFRYFCDGTTDISPVLIDGRNETDETECEQWECNNTYTRCNNLWNCLNGADEVDCEPSSLNCPPHHHICISVETNQPICLPLEKANDGTIDCLEAADEPKLCQSNDSIYEEENFDCQNYTSLPCIMCSSQCSVSPLCEFGINGGSCRSTQYFIEYGSVCNVRYFVTDHYIEKGLRNRLSYESQLQPASFSLNNREKSVEQMDLIIPYPAPNHIISQYKQRCHRGLPLRVWIDKENNLNITACLCPPSFYGDLCQYQNQRVSLTLKFQAHSDSPRTLFAVVVSLIDDSQERIIHSYQQFSYLYIRDCLTKFNIYLLYSTRPKNPSKTYSVHIDIYEKISLTYRGSILVPLKFPVLPVYRTAVHLNIPHMSENFQTCTNQPCLHGKCMKYSADPNGASFCHCKQGWLGRYCNIPLRCTCSPGSLCFGVAANNRSICVCPLNKFGSRCSLSNTVCQLNQNDTCYNGGECVATDENTPSMKSSFCICPEGFDGPKCEKPTMKIHLSFQKDMKLPQSMIMHFIIVPDDDTPRNGSIFKKIPMYQNAVTIHWKTAFDIALMQLFDRDLYIVTIQDVFNESAIIEKTINPSDRCKHLGEILNETIVNLHRIRRMKYYHVPCQQTSPPVRCFFDDIHFCMCNKSGHERAASCFEFDYRSKLDCFGQNYCENGAQCFQDLLKCPKTSMCACHRCFYGTRCQFSSSMFGLSLDAILGYHIQPHMKILQQPSIVQVSLALTIIITTGGLISGVLSVITFKNKRPREIGSDLYLFGSSITTLFTMIMFLLKFWILVHTQMTYSINKSFLNFQCISVDFLLRIGLSMDQWLNACVAVERALTTVHGTGFDKKKSRIMARYIILGLLFFTIGTSIHDPIRRRLIYDGSEEEEKRIWCIVSFSSRLQLYNSIMNMFHFIAPFAINLISAIITIKNTAHLSNTIHPQQSYLQSLQLQIQRHNHIIIAPVVLVILAIPRLILSLVSSCMKSTDDAWLFLIGYFISFIPPTLTFIVFVLPSKSYKKELKKAVTRYRTTLQTYLTIRF